VVADAVVVVVATGSVVLEVVVLVVCTDVEVVEAMVVLVDSVLVVGRDVLVVVVEVGSAVLDVVVLCTRMEVEVLVETVLVVTGEVVVVLPDGPRPASAWIPCPPRITRATKLPGTSVPSTIRSSARGAQRWPAIFEARPKLTGPTSTTSARSRGPTPDVNSILEL